VTVYGPAQHGLSADFILELEDTVAKGGWLPMVMGGDFNLIRNEGEKNTGNFNYVMMDHFNNFVGNHHMREVSRAGSKCT
jgi:hypothetical protein